VAPKQAQAAQESGSQHVVLRRHVAAHGAGNPRAKSAASLATAKHHAGTSGATNPPQLEAFAVRWPPAEPSGRRPLVLVSRLATSLVC